MADPKASILNDTAALHPALGHLLAQCVPGWQETAGRLSDYDRWVTFCRVWPRTVGHEIHESVTARIHELTGTPADYPITETTAAALWCARAARSGWGDYLTLDGINVTDRLAESLAEGLAEGRAKGRASTPITSSPTPAIPPLTDRPAAVTFPLAEALCGTHGNDYAAWSRWAAEAASASAAETAADTPDAIPAAGTQPPPLFIPLTEATKDFHFTRPHPYRVGQSLSRLAAGETLSAGERDLLIAQTLRLCGTVCRETHRTMLLSGGQGEEICRIIAYLTDNACCPPVIWLPPRPDFSTGAGDDIPAPTGLLLTPDDADDPTALADCVTAYARNYPIGYAAIALPEANAPAVWTALCRALTDRCAPWLRVCPTLPADLSARVIFYRA